MRFLFELIAFGLIAGAAFAVGTLVIWLLGSPFEVNLKVSSVISWIALFFVFPGAMNLWIMFRGTATERGPLRVTAGVRGFGMLICAVAVFLKFSIEAVEWRDAIAVFVIGKILWWGSLPFEDHYERERLRGLGLFREEGHKTP